MQLDTKILPPLNKNYILSHVSQETIFERYLGLPVNTSIQYQVPYRRDKIGNARYYYINNVLRFNDWGHFNGDCFAFVGFLFRFDSSTKEGFLQILHLIAQDFNLHKYETSNSAKILARKVLITNEIEKRNKKSSEFDFLPREWNSYDATYWKAIDVTKKYLTYFNVIPCHTIWLNGNMIYTYGGGRDVAYCYYRNSKEKQFYIPFNPKGKKFYNDNCKHWFGTNKLRGGQVLAITKANKDIIVLTKQINKFITADVIAPPGEGVYLTFEQYMYLRRYYNFIISIYDYDRVGMKAAKYHRDNYGIQPIMFTNGNFGTKNFGAKDASDFVYKFKSKRIEEVIQNVINSHTDTIDYVETEILKNLNWIV